MKPPIAVFMIVFFAGTVCGSAAQAQVQSLLKSTDEGAPADNSKAFFSMLEELRDPFTPHLPSRVLVPVAVRSMPRPEVHSSPAAKPAAPVVKPVAAKISPPKLDISGLIWGKDENEQQVIIGGKIFSVGDTVQEAKIIGVSRKGVVILYQGSRFTLHPDTDLKKTGESQ